MTAKKNHHHHASSKNWSLALAALTVSLGSTHAQADDTNNGLAVHGFTDVGYSYDNAHDYHHGYGRGFYLENFDLYLAPDLGGRVRALAEIALEPSMEDQGIGIDTERLQLGYVFSNALTAWVGRFHTPIGFYVISSHHGAFLQTAADKPRFLDFEDHYGVLPVHTTGLWLTGNANIGNGRFGYMFWAGNGDRITASNNFSSLDMNMYHDNDTDTTVGSRLTWFFGDNLEGLQIGVTGLRMKVTSEGNTLQSSGTTADVNFMLLGAHAVYENHGFEFLNELYTFRDKDRQDPAATTRTSWAGYSQLGYTPDGVITPYVKYERAALDQQDPYFNCQYNGLSYSKSSIGFRYNLADNAAIKFEWSHTGFDAGNLVYNAAGAGTNAKAFSQIKSQLAIRF